MSDSILEAAKKLAAAGYTPIPLMGGKDSKRPAIKEWAALRNVTPAQVEDWHNRGVLKNVGILCGEASQNLVVLDFDGMGGYEAFTKRFPAILTYTVATGSGNGMHVYLKVAGELPDSSGQLKVPGGHIEIKADGRQVVAPPSVHSDTQQEYKVVVSGKAMEVANIDEILDWVAEFNPKPVAPQLPSPAPAPQPAPKGDAAEAYARSALEREGRDLASRQKGGRNDALNTAAMKLGQLVAAGALTREEVYRELYSACQSNGLMAEDGPKVFDATFESGYQAGLKQPRDIPQPRNTLPGAPAYQPSKVVVDNDGVLQIGRNRIFRRKSILGDVLERVHDDDYLPKTIPIYWPLRCMHFMGGYAHVIRPGKVVAFVGASGSGKTSALETIADAFIEQGTSVALWSPEWTPDELAERAVQRHGGVTQSDLYRHEIYKWRVSRGEKPDHRDKLPDKAGEETALAIRAMNSWKEEMFIIENTMMNVGEMSEVIAAMRQHLDVMPRVLIADYVQLLEANEVHSEDSLYKIIMRFKAMCTHNQMLGIVATQTRKDDAQANIQDGKFKGTTILNCTKNSPGSKGKVRVVSDPARLRIIDRPHPNQEFDSKAYLLGSQAGRYVNDDAFNLWITVNPEYEEDVTI